MAFLTDLLKQVFTTTATGAVALRAIISGDQNLGGGYISNDQTTTNMMSKGTVYRFLGAVALYDQTSISETYWYDKANGNDGAVTGASVLNPPSVTPLSCLDAGDRWDIQFAVITNVG
jgi:hypothetical protein